MLAFQHLQINSDVLFKSSFLLWCVIVSSFIPRKKSYFTVSNLLFLQCIEISMRVAQHFYEQICIFMTMRLILFAAYLKLISLPASFYLFKVNNRDTRKRCYVCSKLTIKTPEWYHWCHSGGFIINCEHIFHIVVIPPLLTLYR